MKNDVSPIAKENSTTKNQNVSLKQQLTKEAIKKIVRANLEFQKNIIRPGTGSKDTFFPLAIKPLQIDFENVSENNTYEREIEFFNRSERSVRVHLELTNSNYFSITCEKTFYLHQCGRLKAKVIFTSQKETTLNENIIVNCQDMQNSIPIKVRPPLDLLEYQLLKEIGDVQINIPIQFDILITNNSGREAKIDFKFNPSGIEISSENLPLSIFPKKQSLMVFVVRFSKQGEHVFEIVLLSDGISLEKKIKIKANASSNSIHLTDLSGKEVNSIDFGSVFVGEEFSKEFNLVNNSSNKQIFSIETLKGSYHDTDGEDGTILTPYKFALEMLNKSVFFEPNHGEVDKFSKTKIKVVFRSVASKNELLMYAKFPLFRSSCDEMNELLNYVSQIKYTAFFMFDKIKVTKAIKIFAETSLPFVKVSLSELNFGKIQNGESKIKQVRFENCSKFKAICIQAQNMSYVHADPSSWRLNPREEKQVHIVFSPKNLGTFGNPFNFLINKRFEINLSFYGSCVSSLSSHRSTSNFPEIDQNQMSKLSSPMLPLIKGLKSDRQNHASRSLLNDNSIRQQTDTYRSVLDESRDGKLAQKINFRIDDYMSNKFARIPKIINNITQNVVKLTKNNSSESGQEVFLTYSSKLFVPYPDALNNFKENKQLSEELTPENLLKIQVLPIELSFGKMFLKSKSTKFFQLKNNLANSILVTVFSQEFQTHEENPKPETQIVPSNCTAGFKISVFGEKQGRLSKRVLYTINKVHKFHFLVVADFREPDLILSKKQIDFKFNIDSSEFTLTDTVSLKNIGNCPVEYSVIEQPNSCFCIEPTNGTLLESSRQTITITYVPINTRCDEIITLKVQNGGTKTIKCTGVVMDTPCELINSQTNIGEFSTCKKQKGSVSIRNLNPTYCAVYRIEEENLPLELKFVQTIGKINPNETCKIDYEFFSNSEITYKDHEVKIMIRGSNQPLTLFFSAKCIRPVIQIKQEEINFGDISFGTKGTHPLTIVNNSTIVGKLYLNLFSNDPKLCSNLNALKITEKEKGNMDDVRIFEDAEIQKEFGRGTIVSEIIVNSLILKENKKIQMGDEEFKKQSLNNDTLFCEKLVKRLVVFTLRPMRVYNFLLEFCPSKPTVYNFDLNFYLKGGFANHCLKRSIKCTSRTRKLFIDPLSGIIDFQKVIISESDKKSDFTRRSITLTNPHFSNSVTWCFNAAILKSQNTFVFSVTSGVIHSLCSVVINIDFNPIKPQTYSLSIPLLINGGEEEIMITINGEGAYPKPLISCEDIILPIVPLNVTTYGYISLKNIGYDSGYLTALVGEDYLKAGLSLCFPEGNEISYMVKTLSLKIAFTSKIPISFTCKIEIKDHFGRSYYFRVSVASDNSILSYHSYIKLGLAMNTYYRKKLGKNKNLQKYDPNFGDKTSFLLKSDTQMPNLNIVEEEKVKSEDQNNLILDNGEMIKYYKRMAKSINNFFDELGIISVTKFPKSLIAENGAQLNELLESVTEKKMPRRFAVGPDSKGVAKITKLIENYEDLFEFLKEKSLFVFILRPCYLLSYKDFQVYIKTKQVDYVNRAYYQMSKQEFKLISYQTWTNLLLQIIKVFYLGQVTLQSVKSNILLLLENNQKIVSEAESRNLVQKEPVKQLVKNISEQNNQTIKNEDFSVSSKAANQLVDLMKNQLKIITDKNDVFNINELLLLFWMEAAVFQKSSKNIRLYDFLDSLKDFSVFLAVIEVYTNLTRLTESNTQNATTCSFSFNQNLIQESLNELGLSDIFHKTEFNEPTQFDFLFFAINLFRLAPFFRPKTKITFEMPIREKMVKEINLKNSSDKSVTYNVFIKGNQNFKIEEDLITIEAKQSARISISYTSNTAQEAKAVVLFQNLKNGKSRANSLAFNLHAIINKITICQTILFENVPLYETVPKSMFITNPFEKDGNFTVSILNEFNEENVQNFHQNTSNLKKTVKSNEVSSRLSVLPQFYTTSKTLFIKSKSTAEIVISYCPIVVSNHRSFLKLLDPIVGELDFQLLGKSNISSIMPVQKFAIHLDGQTHFTMDVPLYNYPLNKALTKYMKIYSDQNDSFLFELIQEISSENECFYDIELQPKGILTIESAVSLRNVQGFIQKNTVLDGLIQLSMESEEKRTFPFKLGLVKNEPIKETLFSVVFKSRNKLNVRMYEFTLFVFPKIIKTKIDMSTTARIPAFQTVVLTNKENEKQTYRSVVLKNNKPECLIVPTQFFSIGKHEIYNFPINFTSPWMTTVECTFHIINTQNNWTTEYYVKAVCDEPVYETNETILVKPREEKRHSIKVSNPIPSSKEYSVTCDIPNCSYENHISFKNNLTTLVNLSFVIETSGNFLYSLKFTDAQKKYFWLLLTLQVESGVSDEVFKIKTEVRKPTTCNICIENQTNHAKRYKVDLKGEFLHGDKSFFVFDNSSQNYTLYYFPLKIEKAIKQVAFVDESQISTMYNVECISVEPEPITLPIFSAELGKSARQTLKITNPLKKKTISLRTSQSPSHVFTVSPQLVELKAGDSVEIEVIFTPDKLEKTDKQVLIFMSKDIGHFKYELSGICLIPKRQAETTIVFANLSVLRKNITFRNPYSTKTTFFCNLEEDSGSKHIFYINLPNPQSIVLEPCETIEIPLIFSPKSFMKYKAEFSIQNTDDFQWVFPIIAKIQPLEVPVDKVIQTKCGEEVQFSQLLNLPQIKNFSTDEEVFLKWSYKNTKLQPFEKWISIERVPNYSNVPNTINLLVKFSPFKPFATSLCVFLQTKNGYEAMFTFEVVALEPNYFETIEILSQINSKKTIGFVLFNSDKKNGSNFEARFAPESDFSFQVETPNGYLETVLNGGTRIEFSFYPRNFGKVKNGVLLVETDNFLWRFLIKGIQKP